MKSYNLSNLVPNHLGIPMKDGAPELVLGEDGKPVLDKKGEKVFTSPPDITIGALCFMVYQNPIASDSRGTITDKKRDFELMLRLATPGSVKFTDLEIVLIKERLWMALPFSTAGFGVQALDNALEDTGKAEE